MDGTVLDTLPDLRNAINHALAKNGFPARSYAEVRAFVGNGNLKLSERAVPAGSSRETVGRVYEDFTAFYAVHCADETKPYPGITQALFDLRAAGFAAACVSNKDDYAVQALVDRWFPGLFDLAVGSVPSRAKKPAPDMCYFALERLGAGIDNAVFIGDSDVDYATAVNAGLPCVSVTWGFRDRDVLEKAGATCFADTPAALVSLLKTDYFRKKR